MKSLSKQAIIVIILLIIMGPGEAFIDNGVTGVIDWFMDTLLMLPGIVVGLSFHEYAHAKVAQLCGDNTPEHFGRVSLDPRAHIDPTGIICLLFIHFGWGRPVMVNPSNFKHRRLDCILVDLAGVSMNFLVSVVFGLFIGLLYKFAPAFSYGSFGGILIQLMVYTIVINISLMLFNLIPCPPLDGFGVITELFNLYGTSFHNFVTKNSMIILMLLILFDIPSRIISTPMYLIVNWILNIIP